MLSLQKLKEAIVERVKLNPRKRKNEGTRLKSLTPIKLLTRVLLAQLKARNNSEKIKNTISFVSA